MIKINDNVMIPKNEIVITASRSSGPGGQNVNKVSTKVTLRFDLDGSVSLTESQKARLRQQLKNVVNKRGILIMHEESSRSQAANRKRVIEKCAAMISQALKTRKKRVPTRVSAVQKTKRLEGKKIQARKKLERRKILDKEQA